MKNFLSLILMLFVFVNCSTDSPDENEMEEMQEEGIDDEDDSTSFDKTGLLTNWSDNIIIPYYESLDLHVTGFKNIVLDNTDMEFDIGIIDVYRSHYESITAIWQRASMYNFGPAINFNLKNSVNSFPLDVIRLTQNVESGIYDLSETENTFAKGLPSIEYLINIGDSDSETAQILNGPNREAYYAYIVDVLEELEQLFGNVLNQWRTSYRDTFIVATQNSPNGSINIVVNEMIRNFEEEIRFKKIGNPLGICDGILNAGHLETPNSSFDFSKPWALGAMLGMVELFNGIYINPATGSVNGLSFDDYLDFLSVSNGTISANEVNSCINSSARLIEDLPITFREDILHNGGANLQMIYNECGTCIDFMKGQMLSALEVDLNYTYIECN